MRGYFACPMADKREAMKAQGLIGFIESLGHKILDRHVGGMDREEITRIFSTLTGLDKADFNPVNVRLQDLGWVIESEFFICDITHGSWGGGIEFDHATAVRALLNLPPIPILCIYQESKRLSWLILGLTGKEKPVVSFPWYELPPQRVTLALYKDIDDAKGYIKEFLEGIE